MQSVAVLERIVPRKLTLHETALSLGLSPVSLDILEGHQRQQVLLHPPSFIYQNHTQLFFGAFLSAAMCTFMGMALLGKIPMMITLILMGVALGLVFFCMTLLVGKWRGPAAWKTEYIGAVERLASEAIPPSIAEAGRRILKAKLYARLKLGTLYQKSVVLDPYLVAELGNETICLGIWDGDVITASALPE